jgi:hypothetical protein
MVLVKPILGFSILFLCIPTLQLSVILTIIASSCFLLELSRFSITASKFRVLFARLCAQSSAFLICSQLLLRHCHIIIALIERWINFVLVALDLPLLFIILFFGIAMLEGPKLVALYHRLWDLYGRIETSALYPLPPNSTKTKHCHCPRTIAIAKIGQTSHQTTY